MRKILLSIILFFATISSAIAQKLTVESFKIASSDLTAQTQPRKDLNDSNYALIKVGIALDGVKFDGSIMGEPVQKLGEYWVYMPKGVSMLQVLHKNYTPLMINFYDYGIGKVESGETYVLTLKKPNTIAERQTQKLRIKYSPVSASILIDNKFIKGSNGVAEITLPIGQHSFIVACDGYESEEGMIKLKASAPSNLQITLTKEATTRQQSTVAQPAVAQQPVVQTPVTNGDIISIPLKDGISIDMVRVQAGTFTMGATPEMKSPYDDEKPKHRVTLTNDYYIGKYEVTQALWKAVMGDNPSKFKGENLPVEQVSWNDCQIFIGKLNNITGKTFRLPTEAEWEYAARGGKKSKGYRFSGSKDPYEVAWYISNSENKSHPIGSRQANELNIYDMSGNVSEWCQDTYSKYEKTSQINPIGASNELNRVIRGGSWIDNGWHCHSSDRGAQSPDWSHSSLGFRLALSK